MPDLRVEAIDHLVLNVDDIDVSFEWYSNILGMRGKKIISGKSYFFWQSENKSQTEGYIAERLVYSETAP